MKNWILVAMGLLAFANAASSAEGPSHGAIFHRVTQEADRELLEKMRSNLRFKNYRSNIESCYFFIDVFICKSSDNTWTAVIGRDPIRYCIYRSNRNLTKEYFLGGFFANGEDISSYERCRY